MAYDADSFHQLGIFCTTPNASEAGIWQSGEGLSIDDEGAVYVTTGNGSDGNATVPTDRTESIIKLGLTAQGLKILDYFSPSNWAYLDSGDAQLGLTETAYNTPAPSMQDCGTHPLPANLRTSCMLQVVH